MHRLRAAVKRRFVVYVSPNGAGQKVLASRLALSSPETCATTTTRPGHTRCIVRSVQTHAVTSVASEEDTA